MLVFSGQHSIFRAPSLLLARVIALLALVSPLSDNRSCKLPDRVSLTTHQAMPHGGASQFTELAEVHTKMVLIHLLYGSMLIFIMARAVVCLKITLFNLKHKINCIHWFN